MCGLYTQSWLRRKTSVDFTTLQSVCEQQTGFSVSLGAICIHLACVLISNSALLKSSEGYRLA